MYERREPDWRWTAELSWWHQWLDENIGDPPDDETAEAEYDFLVAWQRFWYYVYVRGLAEDEDDLDDLLDKAWGAA